MSKLHNILAIARPIIILTILGIFGLLIVIFRFLQISIKCNNTVTDNKVIANTSAIILH